MLYTGRFILVESVSCNVFQNDIHEIHNDINEEDRINSPTEERMVDLTQRLEGSEIEGQRLSDALEQMTAQKAAFERDAQALQVENERLMANNEGLAAEKWELSAANADLQNRLQAVSYMQVFSITYLCSNLNPNYAKRTTE